MSLGHKKHNFIISIYKGDITLCKFRWEVGIPCKLLLNMFTPGMINFSTSNITSFQFSGSLGASVGNCGLKYPGFTDDNTFL